MAGQLRCRFALYLFGVNGFRRRRDLGVLRGADPNVRFALQHGHRVHFCGSQKQTQPTTVLEATVAPVAHVRRLARDLDIQIGIVCELVSHPSQLPEVLEAAVRTAIGRRRASSLATLRFRITRRLSRRPPLSQSDSRSSFLRPINSMRSPTCSTEHRPEP
ncbi:hypothetical protein [Mesorhizobium neociceri]|uniref:Uncharacterized protein n=1 Tax=Mesorhizobium neociceri TaxID=1307853 RepID=A0A838B2U0_9HYPH|nr:hypothetical protein [Mesorhizobium neociceri]MBA1140946.1 hypothetical protein [Mesorhizobium neociceri]